MGEKNILLVEDEAFIRELYQRILVQFGFRVRVAFDGAEGLSLATGELVKNLNLILLDIMLPKINGIDVLKKLKENPRSQNIPVILLTNLGQESIIVEAFKIGAAGYLMKMKYTPYEIIDKITPFLWNPSLKMDTDALDLEKD